MGDSDADYLLGNTDREHERLIRQATCLAPHTERFLREAGIGQGQRVLDVGSGVGDVAMLAATLVGPSGQVVAVERDARSAARARQRAAEAGLYQIRLIESDVADLSSDQRFDAVVGRYILQFLHDPVGVLRLLTGLLRPGGVVAFQEPCWVPFLQLRRDLPLWSAAVALIYEIGARCGVHMDMGLGLYRAYQQAGLPAPRMHMDVPLEGGRVFAELATDALHASLPAAKRLAISLDGIGDLETLADRLHREIASSDSVVPWIPLVGAWSRIAA